MRTNKRTVWFLTLVSLVAVLSIFYFVNKEPMPFDGLALFGDDVTDSKTGTDIVDDADKQTPVFAESYLFADMRMTVKNERSLLKEQLTTKITSTEYTAVEKNDAYDEMAALTKRDSTEALMEMQIKALGYPDAFVRTDGGQVNITVLTLDGQSVKQANEITHLVMSSWTEARNVRVEFESGS